MICIYNYRLVSSLCFNEFFLQIAVRLSQSHFKEPTVRPRRQRPDRAQQHSWRRRVLGVPPIDFISPFPNTKTPLNYVSKWLKDTFVETFGASETVLFAERYEMWSSSSRFKPLKGFHMCTWHLAERIFLAAPRWRFLGLSVAVKIVSFTQEIWKEKMVLEYYTLCSYTSSESEVIDETCQ